MVVDRRLKTRVIAGPILKIGGLLGAKDSSDGDS